MASAIFDRDAVADLYWSRTAAADRPFGFLPTLTAGPSVSLETTWLDTAGVYFSLGKSIAPADTPLLELVLREWLALDRWPASGQRLLWVDNAADMADIAIQTLAVTPGQVDSPLSQATIFDLKGYLLDLPAGALLAVSPTGDGLQVSGKAAFCVAGEMPQAYGVVQGLITIPVTGAAAGALTFAIDLPNGSDTQTDFDRLDIAIRYGWRVGDLGVDYLSLPALVQPRSRTIRLFGQFTPQLILDPAATRFTFVDMAAGAAPARLESKFVDAERGGLALTPIYVTHERPGGLAFAAQPLLYSTDPQPPVRHYLTLDGSFALDADNLAGSAPRVACGIAALEYLGLDAVTPTLVFRPDAAFHDPSAPEHASGTLTRLATTAWVVPGQTWGYRYFAQPEAAPFFGQIDAGPFLGFLEMPAADIPAVPGDPAVRPGIPMLGYGGIDAARLSKALEVEGRILAPNRAASLRRASHAPQETPPSAVGVTPLGVAAGFGVNDAAPWSWLGLASFQGGTQPDIAFEQIGTDLRNAMMSGRPFLVLTDPGTVMNSATIGYALTATQITDLIASPPDCFSKPDLALLKPVSGATEQDFVGRLPFPAGDPRTDVLLRLAGLLTVQVEDWLFQLSPRNWPPLPDDERVNGRGKNVQTVMVIKLDRKQTFTAWLDDPTSWAWLAATGQAGPQNAIDTIKQAIAQAQTRYDAATDKDASPYRRLLFEVLVDPDWAGMIVFNCDVPVRDLPGDLAPLAAGMDLSMFYANHIGFDASLVHVGTDGTLQFDRGSAFAAIDYEDQTDLVASADIAYGFKTLQLTLGVAGSKVVSFTGHVELMLNKLFDAEARRYPTARGNNVVLDGTRMRQIGSDGVKTSYRFSSASSSSYQLAGSALQAVQLRSVAMVVNRAARNATLPTVDFQIIGDLQFWAPVQSPVDAADPGGFDLFSYGPEPAAPPTASPNGPSLPSDDCGLIDTPFGLAHVIGQAPVDPPLVFDVDDGSDVPVPSSATDAAPTPDVDGLAFAKLIVRMTYDPSGVLAPTFLFVIDDMALNPGASTPRRNGLAARFPAVPTRFVRIAGETSETSGPTPPTPADLGYATADCGLSQAKLAAPWYGIEYDISLGSLGALAGGTEIVLKVIAAWGIDPEAPMLPPIYLGVKLPGSGAGGFQLPLQGILQIGFKSMQFASYRLTQSGTPTDIGYTLRLRDFGLRVLGKTFPSGHIDVLLTGSPTQANPIKLGWYAAYAAADDPVAQQQRPIARRLLAERVRTTAGER